MKRFSSLGVNTMPGGELRIHGAAFVSKSHWPMSAERSSVQLRQKDGLSVTSTGEFVPRSTITLVHVRSKYRSRSAAEIFKP